MTIQHRRKSRLGSVKADARRDGVDPTDQAAFAAWRLGKLRDIAARLKTSGKTCDTVRDLIRAASKE
jgi:hypothetical protein